MSLIPESGYFRKPGPAARHPAYRVVAAVLLAGLAFVLLAACSGPNMDEEAAPDGNGWAPLWRYVNSGWVSPVEFLEEESDPYLKELRVFVITKQEQLDEFNAGFVTKRVSGNQTTLARIDFERSIMLAAYYVWRPVQGDPLSVVGLELADNKAVVEIELSDDPQGREYPYLLAPMVMVAVDRDLFPPGEPVDFMFQLNGEPGETVTAVANGD